MKFFKASRDMRWSLGVTATALVVQATLSSMAVAQTPTPAPTTGYVLPGSVTYKENCSGCHGTDLSGGRGPSLFNPAFLAARTDAALTQTIENGIEAAGMPAFKGQISDDGLHTLVSYLRLAGSTMTARPAFVPSPSEQVVKSEKQTFKIEVVAAGLDTPWGAVFLPDGRMLVTERAGRLRIIAKGKLLAQPVKGTPAVWVRQDSGLLDIALHPDYRRNGWIYLTYTDSDPSWVAPPQPASAPGAAPARQPSAPSMTVVVRGKLNARNEWVQQQTIFRAPYALYTPSGSHYGSRLLFDGKGHLFYSIGERGDPSNAQKLSTPLGKIHRVNEDGSVPSDNPFVGAAGAIPTIWSYGHRNPEGLAFDPVSGALWESEHGPTGGDEINVIEKGGNYGWGVATMGVQPGITRRSAPGMIDPIAYYTPAIAPSGVKFYQGSTYPRWNNSLFVGGLAGQQLRRLEIKGGEIVHQEVVFDQFGRVRQTLIGPDGLMYLLLQNPTGRGTGLLVSDATPGMVVRLAPSK